MFLEVGHLKRYLRYTLKMPNCAAVGYTNYPTKNPNLHFEVHVMSGCLILSESLAKDFDICFKHFEKDCLKRDLKVNTIMVFFKLYQCFSVFGQNI